MQNSSESLMVSMALGAVLSFTNQAYEQAVGDQNSEAAAATPETGLADIVVMGRKRARA